MITVLKKNNLEIVILCSKNERVDILQVKRIAKTIKWINMNKKKPLNVVVKSIDNMCFTSEGRLFFERISNWSDSHCWNLKDKTVLIENKS